jgi:hypothetical protein
VKKAKQLLFDQMSDVTELEEYEIKWGMTLEEKKWQLTEEYFTFNVQGAIIPDVTPIWCEDDFI